MELNDGAFWWFIGFICCLGVFGVARLVVFLNDKFVPPDQDDDRAFGNGIYRAPVDEGYDGWNTTAKPEPADAPIQFKKKLPRKRKPAAKKSR